MTVRAMRTALKFVGLLFVALAVVLIVFIVVTTDFDFKEFGARITVDGKLSKSSGLYLNRFRQSGVVVRRDSAKQRLYAVSFKRVDDKGPWLFPCDDTGYILLPLIAWSEHHSWAQACFVPNLTLKDERGDILHQPKSSIKGTPLIKSRLIEFTDDDGKRVRVEW